MCIRDSIYRLANISSHTQQDDFIRSYETKGLDGYFYLMGKKNAKMFSVFHEWHKAYLPKTQKGSHSYIIGKSGCGKSELMKNLIIQDIAKNDSCVIVIAPDGDMCLEIARQKSLDKSRLVYIDCSNKRFTPIINPIELIQDKEDHLAVQAQAQVIRDAFLQMCSANGQPLTSQQQTLVQPCLDVIIEMGGTLYDMQRMVDDLADNGDILEIARKHPKHGYQFQGRFDRSNLKESKNSIFQKLQQILGLSSVADFFCGKTTIDLPSAIEEKKVIVFNLSKGHLMKFGSLYIGMLVIPILQNIIFQRAKLDKSNRVPISFYIDEFQDYINDSMDEILRQGRKYGVNLTIATQTVGQGMDSKMTDTVLTNTNIKFAGQNNYRNTRTMSNEAGVELEVLQKLQRGEFLTRVGNGRAFVLTGSKLHLDDKTCISSEEWEKVLQDQIKKYYVERPKNKVENKENSPPAPPLKTSKQAERTVKRPGKEEGTEQKKTDFDDEVFTPLYD